jgi:acyl dehydratase
VVVDWYEEIGVGDVMITSGRTITEGDVVNFAMLSGDWNPLHCNSEYASTGPFGQRVAHGMLVLTVMSGLVRLDPPYVQAFYGFDRVRFLEPTLFGDTLTVTSKVVEKADRDSGGVVAFDLTVSNQAGTPIASCIMKILVAGRPLFSEETVDSSATRAGA